MEGAGTFDSHPASLLRTQFSPENPEQKSVRKETARELVFLYYRVVFYIWVEDTPSVLEHTSLYICHSKGKKIAPVKKIPKEGF